MPSLYLKRSIAVNLLTLEVFEETSKVFKELHAITRQMKRKNSTSNKVITLLDETRLDEMGIDDMSIG